MRHLGAEIFKLEEKIIAEKLKLHKAIDSDKPLHTAKEILLHIRALENRLAALKIQQEKHSG